MTAFLIATLLALLVAGALVIIWRERREQFRRAVAIAGGIVLLVGGYVWLVTHGHELLGDENAVTLTDLRIEPVAGSFRLTGKARNNSSDRRVSAIPLTLLIEQCPGKPGEACELLRDSEQNLLIAIPPAEVRPFVIVFSTTTLPHDQPLHFRVAHGGPRTHEAVDR